MRKHIDRARRSPVKVPATKEPREEAKNAQDDEEEASAVNYAGASNNQQANLVDIAIGVSPSEPCEKGSDSQDDVRKNKYDIPADFTKTQKRNLKRKLREKEKRAEEAAGVRKGLPQMPEDPLQAERVALVQRSAKALASLPSLAEMKATDVVEKFHEQQAALQSLLASVAEGQENLCTKVKKPDNRRLQPSQLLQQLRDVNNLPDQDDVAFEYLEQQLVLAVSWENAKKFQGQFIELRKKIEERQKINQKCYSSSLQIERRAKIVERIEGLYKLNAQKAHLIDQVTLANLVSSNIETSAELQALLLPPASLSRRVEKLFCVSVDRDKTRKREFVVTGLANDVADALAFLRGDFTGAYKVTLDRKPGAAQLVTKNELRKLEEQFQCLFNPRGPSDLLVFGAPSNAANAVQHFRQASENIGKVIPVSSQTKARALVFVFAKAIRDIEVEHQVTVKVTIAPGNRSDAQDDENGGVVVVRNGTTQSRESAATAIQQLLASLTVTTLPSTEPEVRRLFLGVSFYGEPGGPSGGAPDGKRSVNDQFRDLIVSSTCKVAFLRCGTAVSLVGLRESVEAVTDETRQLLQRANCVIAKIPISVLQMGVFSASRLLDISGKSGATVTCRRAGREAAVEIMGSEEQKQKATQLVKALLEEEGVVEIVKVEKSSCERLLRQPEALVVSFEQEFGARISIDKNNLTCTIVGNANALTLVKNALKTVEGDDVRVVAIPGPEFIPKLIGHKGAIINQIRGSSKVDSIDINESDAAVTIKGMRSACENAERQIITIFATPVATWSPKTSRQTAGEPQADAHPAEARGKNAKRGAAAKQPATGQNATGQNATGGDFFPALDEVTKQQKRTSRRRKPAKWAPVAAGKPEESSPREQVGSPVEIGSPEKHAESPTAGIGNQMSPESSASAQTAEIDIPAAAAKRMDGKNRLDGKIEEKYDEMEDAMSPQEVE